MSVVVQVGSTHLKANAITVNNVCNSLKDGTSDNELKEWKPGPVYHDVKTAIIKSNLPYQFVLQDHNYGAPPPPSPPPPSSQSSSTLNSSSGSSRSSKSSSTLLSSVSPSSNHKVNGVTSAVKQELSEFDTKTAVTTGVEDGQNEKEVLVTSVTRCICEFSHDDEYMICCDKCSVWQHVDCMGLDRNNIPDTYMCEKCEPRKVDKQKAKALQTKKRGQMNESSSEESNTESGRLRKNHLNAQHNGPVHRRFGKVHGRTRKIGRRRKSSSMSCASNENGNCIMSASANNLVSNNINKRRFSTKEIGERKRVCAKRRRTKSKTEFTHVNEETQDVILRKWIDQYEEAVTNQYSTELLFRLSDLKLNGQCEETNSLLTSLQALRRCKVDNIDDHTKGLVASEVLSPNQAICEFRGQFCLSSEFRAKNPLHTLNPPPFVLWYHLDTGSRSSDNDVQNDKNLNSNDLLVCVDATEYGNDARFVRRSCQPNAEIRHLTEKGKPRLYLMARSNILENEEITVAFDFDIKSCIGHVKCACTSENCLVMSASKKNGLCDVSLEKKRRVRRLTSICNVEDGEDGSQSSIGCKKLLLCETSTCDTVSTSHLISPGSATQISSDDSQLADIGSKDDDGCMSAVSSAIDNKKMTREERKMDAIVKAFERMEKAQQRRQEAQARQQQRKVDQKRKSGEDQGLSADGFPECSDVMTNGPTSESNIGQSIKNENSLSVDEEGPVPTMANSQPNLVPTSNFRNKLKGRRRKTSGAPSRRSSRVNSGGSDVCTQDESFQLLPLGSANIGASSGSSTICGHSLSQQHATCPTGSDCSTTHCSVFSSEADLVSSVAALSRPKTKKHLMNEWLNESSEPFIRHDGSTEAVFKSRCKSPSLVLSCSTSTPISSNFLRKSSVSGEYCVKTPTLNGTMGTKKRWLRQAMTEDQTDETACPATTVSTGSRPSTPLTSSSSETTTQRTLPTPDLVTPLKKRRFALEPDLITPPSPMSLDAGDGSASCDSEKALPTPDLVTPLKKRRFALEPDLITPPSPMSLDAGDGSASCDSEKAIPLLRKLQQQIRIDDTDSDLPPSQPVNNSSSNLSCTFPSWAADTSEENAPCTAEDYSVTSSCTNNEYADCDGALAEDLRVPEASRTRNTSPMKPVKKHFVSEYPSSTMEDIVTSSYGVAEASESAEFILRDHMRNVSVDVKQEEDVEMENVQDVAVDLSLVASTSTAQNKDVKMEVVDYSDSCLSSESKTVEPKDETNVTKFEAVEDMDASDASDVENEKPPIKSEINNEELLANVLTIPPPPPPPPPTSSNLQPLNEIVERPSSPHLPPISSEDNQVAKDNLIAFDQVTSPVTSISSTPLSSPKSTSPITQSPLTPVKRKVSLLEYRQRKLENTSSTSNNSFTNTNNTSISATNTASTPTTIGQNTQDTSTSVTATAASLSPSIDVITLPSYDLPPIPGTTSPVKSGKSDGDIQWDSTATSVERQRENLTQRLKREFGLMMEEELHSAETSSNIPKVTSQDVTPLHNRPPIYGVPLCAPVSVVGTPMMVIGNNIPTIVGVRNYGGIRAATPTPVAPPAPNTSYPTAVYGTYPMPAVAPPHALSVVKTTPPPPPPPPPPPHLRPCLVPLVEVPSQSVAPVVAGSATATIIPHSFPLQGFPQIPLQLPPPPPPPLPPPPSHTVPVSVHQIPLPKPQPTPLSFSSDSNSKDGK